MHAVTWLTISGAFVLGMVLTLLGSIKFTLARTLGISESRMGWLVSALHLALIPLMLLSGLLLDAVGPLPLLIAGCIIACLAMQVFTVQTQLSIGGGRCAPAGSRGGFPEHGNHRADAAARCFFWGRPHRSFSQCGKCFFRTGGTPHAHPGGIVASWAGLQACVAPASHYHANTRVDRPLRSHPKVFRGACQLTGGADEIRPGAGRPCFRAVHAGGIFHQHLEHHLFVRNGPAGAACGLAAFGVLAGVSGRPTADGLSANPQHFYRTR